MGCGSTPRSHRTCVTGRSWVLSRAAGGAPGLGGEELGGRPGGVAVLDPQLAWRSQHTARLPLGQREGLPRSWAPGLDLCCRPWSHSLWPRGFPEPTALQSVQLPLLGGWGGRGAVRRLLGVEAGTPPRGDLTAAHSGEWVMLHARPLDLPSLPKAGGGSSEQ